MIFYDTCLGLTSLSMMISRSIHVAANDTTELIYKTEIDSQTLKTNSWLPSKKGREGLRAWVWHVHTDIYGMGGERDLLFSKGNSTQYSVIPKMGKESETKWICVCVCVCVCVYICSILYIYVCVCVYTYI